MDVIAPSNTNENDFCDDSFIKHFEYPEILGLWSDHVLGPKHWKQVETVLGNWNRVCPPVAEMVCNLAPAALGEEGPLLDAIEEFLKLQAEDFGAADADA